MKRVYVKCRLASGAFFSERTFYLNLGQTYCGLVDSEYCSPSQTLACDEEVDALVEANLIDSRETTVIIELPDGHITSVPQSAIVYERYSDGD